MHPRLIRNPDARGPPKRDRLHKRRVEAKLRRQVGLFAQFSLLAPCQGAGGRVEKPIDPLEPAVDPCVRIDVVDLRDRGKPGVPDGLGMVAAEALHQVGEPLVGHHREVRAGVARIDLRAAAALEHGHGLTRRGQQVRGRQAGDAAADHDDIDLQVIVELVEARHRSALGPVRRGVQLRVVMSGHAKVGATHVPTRTTMRPRSLAVSVTSCRTAGTISTRRWPLCDSPTSTMGTSGWAMPRAPAPHGTRFGRSSNRRACCGQEAGGKDEGGKDEGSKDERTRDGVPGRTRRPNTSASPWRT